MISNRIEERNEIIKKFIKGIESGKRKVDNDNTLTNCLLEMRGSTHI